MLTRGALSRHAIPARGKVSPAGEPQVEAATNLLLVGLARPTRNQGGHHMVITTRTLIHSFRLIPLVMLKAHNGLVCLHTQAPRRIVCKECSSLSLASIVPHGSLEAREAKQALLADISVQAWTRPDVGYTLKRKNGPWNQSAPANWMQFGHEGESGTGQRIREMQGRNRIPLWSLPDWTRMTRGW